MKTFTPAIYNIESPVGFDFELSKIQQKLARITWMESIFGKAIRVRRQIQEKETLNRLEQNEGLRGPALYNIFYPLGMKMGQWIDLSYNDSYASTCFFYASDPSDDDPKTDDWDWTSPNVEIAQKFSIILFANLQKLEINSGEYLKLGLLYELNKCPKLAVGKHYESIDNVYSDFDLNRVKQYSNFPYYCIRVECTLTYMAFPFNGDTSMFDPSVNDNAANESILPNINPGYANTN